LKRSIKLCSLAKASDKDILDWLKYAQSRAAGIRLGLIKELLKFLDEEDSSSD
jgi:hypothetical protein